MSTFFMTDEEHKMMWGKHKENGIWIDTRPRLRFMFLRHDCLYLAIWRFRLRIMKPTRFRAVWMSTDD
jgi:hypothetical protein